MIDLIESRFKEILPTVEFCSLRYVRTLDEVVTVRQDVPQPLVHSQDAGAMITVHHRGGLGYAATSDLSLQGLKAAVRRAVEWADLTRGRTAVDTSKLKPAHAKIEHTGPDRVPWQSMAMADRFELAMRECKRLKIDPRIVDWEVSLWHTSVDSLLLTSGGGRIVQRFAYMAPRIAANASRGVLAQTRTFGGYRGFCRQGGLEVLADVGFHDAAPQVAQEAVDLLSAPNCPTGVMDVLLMPDQLILQIHESIGHPLELDRILGDERNYAGTSFVTPDMLGTYRYGSDLLNITFDPGNPSQLASYAYDDEGTEARKVFLIEKGILKCPLGSATSQARSGLPGVANARASSWNRPPIDRMANLNLEPGDSTLDGMIGSIKHGILMKTNNSWSIDDSRNKFQFGCEWGRLIEDGKLTTVVRNPNYRGISATFWRSLKAVGDRATFTVMGTPNCGKGEPNQMIRVGHATPPAVFADVEVFGGAQ